MKNGIKRTKAYILMAETVLTEMRSELDRLDAVNPDIDDSLLQFAMEVRTLLTYALLEYENGRFRADITTFVGPSRRLLARLDAILGAESVFMDMEGFNYD